MRILLLNARYRGGGGERCARELFELLPTIGVETKMLVAEADAQDPPGIRAFQTSAERRLQFLEAVPQWTDWRHRGCIRALDRLSSADFDLVHLHVTYSRWFSIKSLYRLCRRIPAVWTLHDDWALTGGICHDLSHIISRREIKLLASGRSRYLPIHDYHETARLRWKRRFFLKWMPRPRAIITASRFMLDKARESGRFKNADLHLVTHGISLIDRPESRVERGVARATFGLSRDRPVILMVAPDLQVPHKGTLLGLEAIKRLSGRRDVQVLLIGHHAETLRHMLPGIKVVAAQASDDVRMAHAYRAADVTLLPSLTESFSYVTAESLACGTPVVAFRVGALPELLGENERGFLSPPLGVGPLSENLDRVLSDEGLRNALGSAGRVWVESHCRMADYLAAVKSVYERAIAAGGPL